jgi:hypothetical protein
MTLSEAREQLTAIETALANGVKTVERAGRTITYADTEDMMAIADRLRRDIATATGKPSVVISTWTGTK